MRCLTVAKALEATGGWRCGFASSGETGSMVPSINELAIKPLELDGPPEFEAEVMATETPDGCDLMMVDHYQRDEGFEGNCRPWAKRIMVLDDLADRKHKCDWLLDQTLGREPQAYQTLVPDECHLLIGAHYALLRPEFAAARGKALERRQTNGSVQRILVTLGASDPDNATAVVLDGIGQSGVEAHIDVVMGRSAPHTARVQEHIARLPQPAVLHEAPTNMAELMGRADIAIGAAGTTSWERCCLGLPTLMVMTADNQSFVAEQLERAGAAFSLGSAHELTAAKVRDALDDLLRDENRRHAISRQAFEICDGRGIDRVMLALAADGDKTLWLRLATSDDSALMFEWQNHPDTRRFARDPRVPSWDEHCSWMEKTLGDAAVLLMVVMAGNQPVGILRLDQIENSRTREISIYVAPDRYGQGIARGTLDRARGVFPGWTFFAEVMPGNKGSHALFQSAGFSPISETRYVSQPGEPMN